LDGWAAAIIAAIAVLIAYGQWRETQKQSRLRRDEVHGWADEVIDQLQTVLLATVHTPPLQSEEDCLQRMRIAAFKLPVLIERGRLFFKNKATDGFGSEKPAAYRGYRPMILDPLVLAYQITCSWQGADNEDQYKMRILLKSSLENFVSLAQGEVGRGVTASPDTSVGGHGVHLRSLMDQIPLDRAHVDKDSDPSSAGH
jgi:hypothetical protein